MWFRYVWIVMIAIFYAIWTVYVFMCLKDYKDKALWIEHEGGAWIILHIVGIFVASVIYFAYTFGGR